MNLKKDNRNMELESAILVVSEESYLLKDYEEKIRDSLIPPESRDLNYLAFYGWEAGSAEVIEFLQTLPFLADRRLLVLREVHTFKDHKPLMDYLADPNPSSCLLMTSSELKRKDSKFRAISSFAKAMELKKPSGRAMLKWVQDRFSDSDKFIDSGLAEILVQVAGTDMTLLATEIEKVVISSGETREITQEDLAVSVPGGVQVVFSLLDAIGEGDRFKAMSALKNLLDNDNPPEYLIHMMAWHYRQLLRGMELVNSGLQPVQAAEKMGKKYGFKEKFARQLGRAAEKDPARTIRTLASYDLELKRGGLPREILLDRLVLDLLSL